MTEPGGASEVGHIIAYLAFDKSEWNRQIAEAKAEVAELTRLNPTITITTNSTTVIRQLAEVRTASEQVGRQSPRVRVSSNAAEQTFQMHALRDAILLLGPAAVPIAGVLTGALVGALPAAASLILGIKGIVDEEKAGHYAGTQFGADLASIKTEASTLQQIAARGLLPGIEQGLTGARPLFSAVNSEIGTMSSQLGGIIGHLGPGLLNIFTQLDPLFTSFGASLDSGAGKLETWSTNTDSIGRFVAYVETEAPKVEHDLGQILTAAVHLFQGMSAYGSLALHELALVSQAINWLAGKGDNLQTIETVLIAGYAAWRAYGAASAYGANLAKTSADKAAASAAQIALASKQQQLAALEVQFAAEEEAATVAEAKAAEARAQADLIAKNELASAQLIRGFESVAVAAQAEAEEVALSAATIGEAMTALATELEGDAAVIASSWTSVLGPIAFVGVGLGLLTGVMGHNDDQTRKNRASIDSYTESLKQNANALAGVNIEATSKQLQDKGDLKYVDKLADSNKGLALTYGQVALAVNGSEKQYDAIIAKLKAVAEANGNVKSNDFQALVPGVLNPNQDYATHYNKVGAAAVKLANDIAGLRDNFSKAEQIQQEYNAALQQAQVLTDGGSSAVAAHARLLAVTSDAYLNAQQAALKDTEQTQAQTVAWQLANDAGNLLAGTLDKLSGKTISYAQADNNFQQQLLSAASRTTGSANASSKHAIALEAEAIAQQKYNAALKSGTDAQIAAAHLALSRAEAAVASSASKADTSLTGMSAAAVQNRGDLITLVQTAEQAAEAYGEMTGSSVKARAKLIELRKDIIDNAVAHGEDRKAVTAYIDSILKIPTKVPPTKIDADVAAAAKVKSLESEIKAIRAEMNDPIVVNTAPAVALIQQLQAQIEALTGKTYTVDIAATTIQQTHGGRTTRGFASGGQPDDGWFTVGENGYELAYKSGSHLQIFSNQRSRNIMAGRGSEPLSMRGNPTVSGFGGTSTSTSHTEKNTTLELHLHNPLPETAAEMLPTAMRAAEAALDNY